MEIGASENLKEQSKLPLSKVDAPRLSPRRTFNASKDQSKVETSEILESVNEDSQARRERARARKSEELARSRAMGERINEKILGELGDETKIAEVFPKSISPYYYSVDFEAKDSSWSPLLSGMSRGEKVKIAIAINPLLRFVLRKEPAPAATKYLKSREVDTLETLGELRLFTESELRGIIGLGKNSAVLIHSAVKKREPQAPKI